MDRVREHQTGPASQQSMQAMPCPICSTGLKKADVVPLHRANHPAAGILQRRWRLGEVLAPELAAGGRYEQISNAFSTAAEAFHQAEMRAPHRLCQFNAARRIKSPLGAGLCHVMSINSTFSLCFPVAAEVYPRFSLIFSDF